MKTAILISVVCLMAVFCFCQSSSTALYKKVMLIEKNTALSNKQKLTLLTSLQNNQSQQNKTSDSGTALLLIKLAKYESVVNNNYNIAIQYSTSSLHILSSLQQKPVAVNINCLYNLGLYYQSATLFAHSLTCFDSVIALCNRFADPSDYKMASLHQKVSIEYQMGDYQKVIDESIMGLQISKLAHDSSQYLYFLNRFAQSNMVENNFEQAMLSADLAVVIAQKNKDAFELGTAYKIKALIFEKEKNFKEAKPYFLAAIKAREATTDYGQIASDYNDLGNFYLNSLQDYEAAKNSYKKTIENAAKTNDSLKQSFKKAMANINLGYASVSEKNYTDAIRYYNNATQYLNLPIVNYLTQNPLAKQLTTVANKDVLFELLSGKIQLLLRLYNQTKNKTYLFAGLQTSRLTDSVFTQLRHEQFDEQSKLYWRNKTRIFFSNAIDICFLLNNESMAFYFLEKSRSVLLFDKMNELAAASQLSFEEMSREKNYHINLIEQEQKLSTLQPGSSEYTKEQEAFVRTKEEMETYIKLLEKKYPVYYQNKYADNVPSLPMLQAYLKQNNQSFVYYFMNDSAMYALAITKNKTRFIKIPVTDFDPKQLSQFLNLCSNKEELNRKHNLLCSLSQNINKKLFEPLQIPEGNVAICTDNFFIPFEALCSDEKGKKLLLYNYDISYAYSARSLMKPFESKAATGNFIGFAPVSFSSSLQVPDLTPSANALQNVADWYSNNTLFTENEATRNNFFNEAAQYSVVTIFSHAKADTTDTEPELFMQDSVIHLSELQRLINSAIQFVLLSACQTNIGKNATGEGIYSLARGFAAAGIPSVSATLWKADEAAVYQISIRFNEYLAQGMNKSKALRKAKIWYLQHADHEHTMPYYWANMVLIGSSQPVVLSSSNPWWLWVSGVATGVVLTAVLFYFFFYRKKNKLNLNSN